MIPAGELKKPEATGWRPSSLWPEKLLGRRPGLKEINLVCWGLFVAFLLVPIGVVVWIQVSHGQGNSIPLHSDFVLYYGDGMLANNYPPAKIYDPDVQHQIFMKINPAPHAAYGVSPYPPFIPYFFGFFARLSFIHAYFLWMLLSLGIYIAGIASIAASAFRGERWKTSLLFCFALAFYPFVGSTLVNGQLASFAVCSIGLAIYLENKEHSFYGGLALSFLIYKPTLLILIFPMLLITRRFRMLLGFIAGSALLVIVSTALGGLQVLPAYVGLLKYHSRLTGLSGKSVIQLSKYLDLGSLSHMIPGGRTQLGLACFISIAVIATGTLARLLWKSRSCARPTPWLAWTATLTWTLLINVYVPIYDSVIVVIAIALIFGALEDLHWSFAEEWIVLLVIFVFVSSWKTETFQQRHHIQLLSVALFLLGVVQLFLLHRAMQRSSASAVPPSA